jgi:Zn-dependent protease
VLLFNPTIEAFIAVGIVILVAFPVHEFAHALAAYQLGDSTARLFGRLTIDPRAHIDPVGAILLAVAGFGWAKPTPVNPYNLRGGRNGEALVALAGPLSNLVLAAAAALPLRFIFSTGMDVPPLVVNTLVILVTLNLLLMVFNLVPIPPLDGSKVLFAFLSPRLSWQWRPILEQYGFIILILVFFFPPGNSIGGSILRPILNAIYGFLVGA